MTKSPIVITLVAVTSLAVALCASLAGRDSGLAWSAAPAPPSPARSPSAVDDPRSDGAGVEAPAGDCQCELARRTNAWCRGCGVGYVATIRIPSAVLFEALDAHGHAIDPDLLRCDACQRAVETDGFCDRSGIGYVGRQAYLSKLAYYAARGEVKEHAALSCPTCRKNAEAHGWCEACGRGMVGRLALESRAHVEEAREAFDRLGRALRRLATCETCAVATATGGRCPLCRIAYGAEQE